MAHDTSDLDRGDAPHYAIEVIAIFDGTIVEARHFDDPRAGVPRDFTVGSAAGSLLPITSDFLPPQLALLRSTGGGYELLWMEGIEGEITVRDRPYSLVEAGRLAPHSPLVPGARAIPFGPGMFARVEIGATTIHVKAVAPLYRQPTPLRFDLTPHRYTGGLLAAVVLFLMIAFAIPPDASALSLSDRDMRERFARFNLRPPVEAETPKPDWYKPQAKEQGGRGRDHKGPAGSTGDKHGPRVPRLVAIKGDSHSPRTLAREQVQDMVRDAGVLGVLTNRSPQLSSFFSTTETAIGDQAENAMGNLIGTEIGAAYGAGGLDLVGSGRGGNGNGENTLGVGSNLGKIGRGGGCSGCSGDYGRPTAVARLHDRHPKGPEVVYSRPEVSTRSGLDKDTIRLVIRRHINEVRFCYEEALQRQPELAGKVVVAFAISPVGMVASASVRETTMANLGVGQCVSQAVRRWEFPKAPNGGLTIVSYPFAFHAAGE